MPGAGNPGTQGKEAFVCLLATPFVSDICCRKKATLTEKSVRGPLITLLLQVYLRDDRKEATEQLKLCEVEVFGFRDFEGKRQFC